MHLSGAFAVDGRHECGARGAALPKPQLSGVTRILELEWHSVIIIIGVIN